MPFDWTDFEHPVHATWFWVETPLDIDTWTRETGFQERAAPGLRWRSTVHLVGDGGWVWLIRLPDDSTSVGIVVDPARHDPEELSTEAGVRAWLSRREPECAAAIADWPLEALRTLTWSSGGRDTVVSDQRWALIGDATGFLDPLYSSGVDQLALIDELLVPAILADLDGEDASRRCRRANRLFQQLRAQYMSVYRGVFDLMDNPQVMMARILWDQATYFGFVCPLIRSGELGQEGVVESLTWHASRVADLQVRVAAMLRAWAAAGPPTPRQGFVDMADNNTLLSLVRKLREPIRGRSLPEGLMANLGVLEAVAVALFRQVARALELSPPDEPLNPYGVGLRPDQWSADGLTAGIRRCPPASRVERDLVPAWLGA